ncbi:RNA-binding S4 domain-containing protein [Paenibacillus yanchengensis]|uniref:RQC P-site tRNA stabilizing factor n=1 Tax=Paenibacillus yanchengensis TaxID=2035833 RepID=A0ABW4YIE7_9BACL
MRLDKFLKVSRLIKRRTVAKEITEQGRIWINDRVAKPSTVVKVGDELAVQYGQKTVTVRVESLVESVRKAEAKEMYIVLKEEQRERAPQSEEADWLYRKDD